LAAKATSIITSTTAGVIATSEKVATSALVAAPWRIVDEPPKDLRAFLNKNFTENQQGATTTDGASNYNKDAKEC
jgi:hypothetical protein